ncbi:hypothetical protein GY45DRAFT_46013 [Cubamyces sp. BRFM 1775]|nr:hypothetical protein GY45DRAFT_46013 [Cubamyces sp. BRFM 1775]
MWRVQETYPRCVKASERIETSWRTAWRGRGRTEGGVGTMCFTVSGCVMHFASPRQSPVPSAAPGPSSGRRPFHSPRYSDYAHAFLTATTAKRSYRTEFILERRLPCTSPFPLSPGPSLTIRPVHDDIGLRRFTDCSHDYLPYAAMSLV